MRSGSFPRSLDPGWLAQFPHRERMLAPHPEEKLFYSFNFGTASSGDIDVTYPSGSIVRVYNFACYVKAAGSTGEVIFKIKFDLEEFWRLYCSRVGEYEGERFVPPIERHHYSQLSVQAVVTGVVAQWGIMLWLGVTPTGSGVDY